VSEAVDWTALAERLGTITWTEGGRAETGGTDTARRAMIELLGERVILGAVAHYLSHEPGDEVARSILRELRPPAAIDRCIEIYQTSSDIYRVRDAVELLRWVADERALDWYPVFMQHEDYFVRLYAVGVIDQLWMYGEIEPQDAIARLQIAITDEAEVVRSRAEQVIEMLKDDIALTEAGMGASEV
jgi:HEAT repeat protein